MQHTAFPLHAEECIVDKLCTCMHMFVVLDTITAACVLPQTPCSVISVYPHLPNLPFLFTVIIAIMSAGIKAIKLYAWEQSFKERILSLRHLELTQIRHVAYLEVIQSLVFGSTPILIALSAFAVYTAQGHPLTPAVAFPALALFNLLRFPITMLPWYLMEFINGWVALGRMQRFMQVSLQRLP